MRTPKFFILFFVKSILAYVDRNDTYYMIWCIKNHLVGYLNDGNKFEIKNFNATTTIDYVAILTSTFSCNDRYHSYVDVLKSFNLNIPRTLYIDFVNETDLSFQRFKGLTIEALDIEYALAEYNRKGLFVPNFLSFFEELRVLTIIESEVPELPPTKLKRITLKDGKSLGAFGNCSHLENLTLIRWNTTLVPRFWLSNCKNLQSITFESPSFDSVKTVLSDVENISNLTISQCEVYEWKSLPLEELLNSKKNIRKLKLNHNKISKIPKTLKLDALEEVDLSYNELRDLNDIFFVVTYSRKLVHFNVSHNPLLDMCNFHIWKRDNSFLYAPNIKTMSFAYTSTTSICFEEVTAIKMEYLDLSGNPIKFLAGLPLQQSRLLKEINLTNTSLIEGHDFNNEQYEILAKRRYTLKMTGVTLSLKCDCSDAWLAYAIRDNLLSLTAYCGTTRLEHMPNKTIACDKYQFESCICRRSWLDGSVKADCSFGNQKNIPNIPKLTHLIARGNIIEGFNATDLSEDLIELDLTQNHIAQLDTSTLEALFNVSKRRVYLSMNPIICTCENVEMLEELQKYKDQIVDYDNMTCVGGEQLVSSIDVIKICEIVESGLEIALAVVLALVAIAAVVIALWTRFKRQIKILLYARGCCLWWLTEKEIDSDRPYDAFLSFAHGDDEFVMTNLLPELEKMGYRVCVHYRDWIPGEWIPSQIQRSVQLSRRTIIVVSKNYLDSVWGMMEFRIAHISTLKEGRPRIIALLLEDVATEDLNDELKGYLDSNTYAKWGEKWFWDKMKYALQHRIMQTPEQDIEMEERV